jgi:hypothetical protein
MWLLNARTISLEDFFEDEAPPYAILSHTWGKEEVSFQNIQGRGDEYISRLGYDKIARTCKQALDDGLEYAWVDTCCIDKQSSAELSEAINSMFRWYQNAEICYAYLADVPAEDDLLLEAPAFSRSRWFTRGWTLQELLAPEIVVFYASNWSWIATRNELSSQIELISGIDENFLRSRDMDLYEFPSSEAHPLRKGKANSRNVLHLWHASIAERMSWAVSRNATRPEDIAYCLLSIFDINMPLLYGEGAKAFTRLQEELPTRYDDQSLLAWDFFEKGEYSPTGVETTKFETSGILAASPAAFAGCAGIVPSYVDGREAQLAITNEGLRISLSLSRDDHPYAILRCQYADDPSKLLVIPLNPVQGKFYVRDIKRPMRSVDHKAWSLWPHRIIFLMTRAEYMRERWSFPNYSVVLKDIQSGFSIKETYPQAIANNAIIIATSGYTVKSDERLILAIIEAQPGVIGESNPQEFVLAVHFLLVRRLSDEADSLVPKRYSLRVQPASDSLEDLIEEISQEKLHLYPSYLVLFDRTILTKVQQQSIFGSQLFLINLHMSLSRSKLRWYSCKHSCCKVLIILCCKIFGPSALYFIQHTWISLYLHTIDAVILVVFVVKFLSIAWGAVIAINTSPPYQMRSGRHPTSKPRKARKSVKTVKST